VPVTGGVVGRGVGVVVSSVTAVLSSTTICLPAGFAQPTIKKSKVRIKKVRFMFIACLFLEIEDLRLAVDHLPFIINLELFTAYVKFRQPVF
jgi:hypothetical protein